MPRGDTSDIAFDLKSLTQRDAGSRMMQAYEPQNPHGGTDWFKILKMLPQMGSGMRAKSQRSRRLGSRDASRTRMKGLYAVLGIPPWG